jgi:hypothetical protein
MKNEINGMELNEALKTGKRYDMQEAFKVSCVP